jgi:hypothetical protein
MEALLSPCSPPYGLHSGICYGRITDMRQWFSVRVLIRLPARSVLN